MTRKVMLIIGVTILVVCDMSAFWFWWWDNGSIVPKALEEYSILFGSLAIWVWWLIDLDRKEK